MADFAMLEGLRATRDADTCLGGLNAFRAGLRGEGGPAFLARYLRQSPEWQELQNVWDAQLTVSAAPAAHMPPPPLPAACQAPCLQTVRSPLLHPCTLAIPDQLVHLLVACRSSTTT